MKKPAVGQFWRDVQIGDLLKILEISTDDNSTAPVSESESYPLYVRCMCIVRGKPFGIQEMKASRLDGDRFIIVPKILSWWYERKYKKVK